MSKEVSHVKYAPFSLNLTIFWAKKNLINEVQNRGVRCFKNGGLWGFGGWFFGGPGGAGGHPRHNPDNDHGRP
jgi:hypothetical protein